MFKIMVRQFHDGAYIAARNVPDHITNAGHRRIVIMWIEENRPGIMRAGYKIEKV